VAYTNPVLAYSVTIQLSPRTWSLCAGTGSITEGNFLSSSGTTLFQVIDNGGGSYNDRRCGRRSELWTDGQRQPCSTSPSRAARRAARDSITVTAVDVRDCSNGSLPANPGPPGTVPIDNAGAGRHGVLAERRGSVLIGSSQKISWTATDNTGVANVDIDLFDGRRCDLSELDRDGVANSGSFVWTVPKHADDAGARARHGARRRVLEQLRRERCGLHDPQPGRHGERPVAAARSRRTARCRCRTVRIQAFSITADPCYSIADVWWMAHRWAGAELHVRQRDQDHTINATFSLIQYTITATNGPGGSMRRAER
jgi:hypothetical protein